jgi:uncharacterized membrane protein
MNLPSNAYRVGIAVTAAVSGAVALYLHLWKVGYLAQAAAARASGDFQMLQCAVGGGCVKVQTSGYGWFLGVDVALIGTLGYASILLVAALGLAPGWLNSRGPTLALMTLIFPAVLFTVRLKYAEFYLMRTFCSWCAVSTVAITVCAVLVLLDHRRIQGIAGGRPDRRADLEPAPARDTG